MTYNLGNRRKPKPFADYLPMKLGRLCKIIITIIDIASKKIIALAIKIWSVRTCGLKREGNGYRARDVYI